MTGEMTSASCLMSQVGLDRVRSASLVMH